MHSPQSSLSSATSGSSRLKLMDTLLVALDTVDSLPIARSWYLYCIMEYSYYDQRYRDEKSILVCSHSSYVHTVRTFPYPRDSCQNVWEDNSGLYSTVLKFITISHDQGRNWRENWRNFHHQNNTLAERSVLKC